VHEADFEAELKGGGKKMVFWTNEISQEKEQIGIISELKTSTLGSFFIELDNSLLITAP
jgi:hypothetical protein